MGKRKEKIHTQSIVTFTSTTKLYIETRISRKRYSQHRKNRKDLRITSLPFNCITAHILDVSSFKHWRGGRTAESKP